MADLEKKKGGPPQTIGGGGGGGVCGEMFSRLWGVCVGISVGGNYTAQPTPPDKPPNKTQNKNTKHKKWGGGRNRNGERGRKGKLLRNTNDGDRVKRRKDKAKREGRVNITSHSNQLGTNGGGGNLPEKGSLRNGPVEIRPTGQ